MSLQDIKKAISLLNQGNLVAFPTETVYGLGADFSNEDTTREFLLPPLLLSALNEL